MSGDGGLTTNEVCDLLREVFSLRGAEDARGSRAGSVPPPDGALVTKLKHLRANGCPSPKGPSQGHLARYDLGDVAKLVACFAVMEAGLSGRLAAEMVMRDWPVFASAIAEAAKGRAAQVGFAGAGLASLRASRRGGGEWKARTLEGPDDVPAAAWAASAADNVYAYSVIDVRVLAPRMAEAFAERARAPVAEVMKRLRSAVA